MSIDMEMFRLTKTDLQALAAGRGKQAERAQAELDRRIAKKEAKRAEKAAA
jgi:hypothetical protein